jgi:hypothetical protein
MSCVLVGEGGRLEVAAAAGARADRGRDVLTAHDERLVDAPEPAGQREPFRLDVDADHERRPERLREHSDREPDGADAGDEDAVAAGDPGANDGLVRRPEPAGDARAVDERERVR